MESEQRKNAIRGAYHLTGSNNFYDGMITMMLVALGGMFSEHSGIINIALEGIMVIGGVAGVLTLTLLPAGMPDSAFDR